MLVGLGYVCYVHYLFVMLVCDLHYNCLLPLLSLLHQFVILVTLGYYLCYVSWVRLYLLSLFVMLVCYLYHVGLLSLLLLLYWFVMFVMLVCYHCYVGLLWGFVIVVMGVCY